MKQHTTASNKSVRLGLFFCVLVSLIIGVSLFCKGIVLLKQSVYTNDSRFTFVVTNPQKQQKIISFDTQGKKEMEVLVTSSGDIPSLIKTLGLPVDSVITTSYEQDLHSPVSSLLRTAIIRYSQVKTTLTPLDLAKLYFLSRTVQPGDTSSKSITLPQDSASIDQFLSSNLVDSGISKDNQTIQIINVSGVSGAGSTVEHMLNRMGGVVISVTTGRTEEEHTTIQYAGENTYTVNKFKKIFNVPVAPIETKMISDIIIKLGKDRPLLVD